MPFSIVRFVTCLLAASSTSTALAAVRVDYKTLASKQGDGIPDFSYAGYHASDKALPDSNSPVKTRLAVESGDQTDRIQAALDKVSSENGGGVVLLGQGKWQLDGGLVLRNGTVLRGSGVGMTTLLPKASSDAITFGEDVKNPAINVVANITNCYVGVGASSFKVSDASKLKIGQDIMVQRAATAEWIRANGMADLVRDGKPQTWVKVSTRPKLVSRGCCLTKMMMMQEGSLVQQPRKIKAIKDDIITVDIPLTDSINKQYMQGQVAVYTFPSAASELGVENLSLILNPSCSGVALADKSCSRSGINFKPWAKDSWVRNVNMTGFNTFVNLETRALRVTIENVNMHRDNPTDTANGLPADIAIRGTQVLVKDCASFGVPKAVTFPVATHALIAGPNAVVNYYTELTNALMEPHQRWSHGFLIDSSKTSLKLYNRGIFGTGHGWTINAGVAWNVEGDSIEVASSPLGTNWCIGCKSAKLSGNGTFIEKQSMVEPASLFAAQLDARRRQ